MTTSLSSLSALTSLLSTGAANPTDTANTQSTTIDFQKYLTDALNGSSTTGTTSTTDVTAYLTELLNGSSSELTPVTTTTENSEWTQLLNSLSGDSSATTDALNYLTGETAGTSSDDVIGQALTNSFQTSMLANMNAAKQKMQSNYASYVERVGTNSNEQTKLQMQTMQKNISILEQYMTASSTGASSSDLLSMLTTTSNTSIAMQNALTKYNAQKNS